MERERGEQAAEQARLAEIRARAEKATPGPWRVVAELILPRGCPSEVSRRASGQAILRESETEVVFDGACVEDIVAADGEHVFCGGHDYDDHGHISRANAEFITYAREDVPYLLDQVEALASECARLRAAQAQSEGLHQLVARWRNYRRENEQEQTPGFYRGLLYCADELEALLLGQPAPPEGDS